MTPIRKPKNTSLKKSIPVSSQNPFFAPGTVPEEAPRNIFYCDSPSFEMQVCVFAHLLTSPIRIVLLVNLTLKENSYVC